MEHLNYCRQLALQAMNLLSIPSMDAASRPYFVQALDLCAASQKFILPLNGVLLDDVELRALDPDMELRLPHQFIAIEYRSESIAEEWAPVRSTKRIVFARETDDGILISPAAYLDADGTWAMYGTVVLPRYGSFARPTSGPVWINKLRVVSTPDVLADPRDFDSEVSVVLSFLNALACSNVHIERSEPKNAGKKIKAALPFDTYHVLTIDVPGRPGERTGAGGDHRSPREHLRRGHIRRLADGRRVWVNATVVSAGSGGAVKKDYALRRAA